MSTAVIIVHYRVYDDLKRCLASLAPHITVTDDVVIVDYEAEPEALADAVAPVPRTVRIPRVDNLGFAAGVNLGAAQSKAPFILLLNPDAVVEGPVVRELEAFLRAQPDVGVAGARVLNADGTLQASARRFPDWTTWLGGRTSWLTATFPQNWFSSRNLVRPQARSALPVDVDWLSGSCLMTRRDLFERLGGFDEGFFLYWEDADYCSRVAEAGFRRVYLPTVAVRHVAGRSAHQNPIPAIRAFHDSAFRLYWKRASRVGRFFAPVVKAALQLRGRHLIRRATPLSERRSTLR